MTFCFFGQCAFVTTEAADDPQVIVVVGRTPDHSSLLSVATQKPTSDTECQLLHNGVKQI